MKKMPHLTWQLHLLVKIMNKYKASVYEASLSWFILTYTSNSSCVVNSSRHEAEQTKKPALVIE